MEYRTLGRAGVKVSPLCLGTAQFPDPAGEAESIHIIQSALDAGINFLDTANIYREGRSEEVIGRALEGRRDGVILATKVHGPMGDEPNDAGNSRYHIMRQVEASLGRLQTDHIDLYQLHGADPDTPLDEQLSVLTDLVRQGKVRYIGTSNFPAWQLCESLWISEKHNFERFVCHQPPYSILSRGVEEEILPFCRAHGFAVIPYSPLHGGWLTGKYRKGQQVPPDSRAARNKWDMDLPVHRRWMEAVEKLVPLAQEHGATLSQFSLAWLLANPAVTAPIIGPRTPEQLADNLGALEVKLTEESFTRVDEILAFAQGDSQ